MSGTSQRLSPAGDAGAVFAAHGYQRVAAYVGILEQSFDEVRHLGGGEAEHLQAARLPTLLEGGQPRTHQVQHFLRTWPQPPRTLPPPRKQLLCSESSNTEAALVL
jgi:hypothetical protein